MNDYIWIKLYFYTFDKILPYIRFDNNNNGIHNSVIFEDCLSK